MSGSLVHLPFEPVLFAYSKTAKWEGTGDKHWTAGLCAMTSSYYWTHWVNSSSMLDRPLFVTTFCINVTHVFWHIYEIPMVKEQGSMNLIPFPASCMYKSCWQQARQCLAFFFGLYWKSMSTIYLACPIRATVISGSFKMLARIWLLLPPGNRASAYVAPWC